MQIPEHSQETFADHDEVICRCLKVRLSTVAEAIEVCGLSSIREIKCVTGAGDGCTCCHARIRQLLHQRAVERENGILVP